LAHPCNKLSPMYFGLKEYSYATCHANIENNCFGIAFHCEII
jgi:hypothetical protein